MPRPLAGHAPQVDLVLVAGEQGHARQSKAMARR
jgi:hypothetical protein